MDSDRNQPPGRAITIAILAMGGEGGGVLADWIVDLAEHEGFVAQTTSVPGVAQRTGATVYYVELFPSADRSSGSPPPVLSLMPVPGHVDVVIASELMEAGRAIQRGFVTPDRTTLIASTHRVYSMKEKTAMGDGRIDSRQLLDIAQSAARRLICADYAQLALESGSVISAVMFGVVAGSNVLPFSSSLFEAIIRRSGIGGESSLRAFAKGHASATNPAEHSSATAVPARKAPGPDLVQLSEQIGQRFPADVRDVLIDGIMRLSDYQDPAYAQRYLKYLEPFHRLEISHGDGRFRLFAETARHLALWMSYEDAIRVADLKIRRSRFLRVSTEAAVRGNQLVEIDDFFHPRAEEIADILPAALGRWVLSSKKVGNWLGGGRVIRSTSLSGYLQLYGVSQLRRWRRHSLRFAVEQRRLEAWLATIQAIASTDYELAIAAAESQKLIRGYGDTQRRGNTNFDVIFRAIDRVKRHSDPASVFRSLIQAANSEEHGETLERVLRSI